MAAAPMSGGSSQTPYLVIFERFILHLRPRSSASRPGHPPALYPSLADRVNIFPLAFIGLSIGLAQNARL